MTPTVPLAAIVPNLAEEEEEEEGFIALRGADDEDEADDDDIYAADDTHVALQNSDEYDDAGGDENVDEDEDDVESRENTEVATRAPADPDDAVAAAVLAWAGAPATAAAAAGGKRGARRRSRGDGNRMTSHPLSHYLACPAFFVTIVFLSFFFDITPFVNVVHAELYKQHISFDVYAFAFSHIV